MKFRILLLFFCLNTIAGNYLYAQCCSGGNAMGGSSDVGIVGKKNLKVATFYKYSFSDSYYEGDARSSQTLLKSSEFNFLSLLLAYGITSKLTAEAELGYFFNKRQHFNLVPDYRLEGYGFSTGVISLKYNLYRNKCDDFEYTAGLGLKFPFTREPLLVDDVLLPVDLQPSTNAYGVVVQSFLSKKFTKLSLRAILVNRFEYNGVNNNDYQFGSVLYSSLFIAKKVYKNISAVLLIRDEWKQKDIQDGKEMQNTGNQILVLSPQINYTFYKTWSLSVLYDYPVYKNYNGKQLANTYAFGVSLVKTFKFLPKEKKPPVPPTAAL